MFKVSAFNPKDKTLDEIHKVQKKIYNEDKSLSANGLVERYNSSISKLSREYKINFHVTSLKEELR